MKLWMKILLALLLGILFGAVFGEWAVYLKPIGQLFLNMINMIIIPLVLSSMIVGITSIHDPQKLSRVSLKTLLVFLVTTVIAIVLGIGFGYAFEPGAGLGLTTDNIVKEVQAPTFGEILDSIIPTNPFAAMASGNVLQVIVFAIFIGISINFAGPRGKPLFAIMESLADVMYRLTSIVMEFSPIGVFAIMGWVAGSFGLAILLPLFKFLALYYFACLLHMGIVYFAILKYLARLNPIPFFKGMSDAIVMAFSTCSSSATLPVSMHCAQENLGVSKNISNFILPLGSTINMNGSALFQGMSAIFIAQGYGLELSLQAILTIVITATLGAIGAAGIPGTGLIMLTVVLSSVGIPIEGLALLAGIDRIREMISTVLNVLGDAVCAVYVAQTEGELDERKYYHKELKEPAA